MRIKSIKRNGEIILNFPFLNFFIGKMKVMQVFSVVLYPNTYYLPNCIYIVFISENIQANCCKKVPNSLV